MYWGWAQGYINLKVEGEFKDNGNSAYSLHIGGFGSSEWPFNTIRQVNLNFGGQKLNTSGSTNTTLLLKADMDELFKTPQTISLKQVSAIHAPNANAVKMADNYADMIKFVGIQ
jgi:hypothetical protein